jgi:hypothetical protein
LDEETCVDADGASGANSGPGFAGKVTVTPLVFPGPIKATQVTIAEGQAEATVPFDVAPGARPGEYTLSVRGQAQVTVEGPRGPGSALATLPARPVTPVVRVAVKK